MNACFTLRYWIEASKRPEVNSTTFSMLAFLGKVTKHSDGWEGFPLLLWCIDWSPDLPPSGERSSSPAGSESGAGAVAEAAAR